MHPLDVVAKENDGSVGRPKGGTVESNLARKYAFAELGTPENDEVSHGGAVIPQVDIKVEKPEHRLMVMLKAQGKSHKEIAETLGYTPVHVSTVLAQPWARKRLMEEINTAGRDGLSELFKGAAADSVFTLIEIRDDKTVSAGARLAASKELLDRWLGKSVQNTNVRVGEVKELNSLEDIERELVQLRAREQDLVGRPPVREVSEVETTKIHKIQ